MKAHENIKLIKRFYRAARRGDYDVANAILETGMEYAERNQPALWFSSEHSGAAAVLEEAIGPIGDKITRFSLKMTRFFAVGDNVIATGSLLGHAVATERELHAPVAHIWTIRNGKAIRFEALHDLLAWREALPDPELKAAA